MRLLFLIFILSSCVTQKGVQRWIKKNPDKLTIDSVKVIDTLQFITEKVYTDTLFSIHTQDTVVIKKENLTIKTFFHKDSIYVYGECDTDTVTVIQERLIGTNLNLEEKKGWFEFNWMNICILAVLVILIFRK